MPDYATLAQARDFGITTTEAADAFLTTLLELASRVVDNYTGRDFAVPSAPSTITIYDVRNPVVPLPTPFSAVTEVKINDSAIASTSYSVESWGLRIYQSGSDVDGFPRAYSPLARRRIPYGVKVAVTATFGYSAVPSAVRQATILLAAHMVRDKDSLTAGGISQLSVEGYSVSYGGSQTAQASTTGVPEADRLLSAYRRVLVG